MPNDVPDYSNTTIVSSGFLDVSGGSIAISAGQDSVNVSTDTPPAHVGDVSVTAGNTSANANFNLPANATGIRVVLKAGGSSSTHAAQPRVTIKGNVSGQILADVICPFSEYLSSKDGVIAICALSGEDETSVNVAVVWNNFGGIVPVVVASVYAFLGTGVQQVYSTRRQPLSVESALPQNQLQTETLSTVYINSTVINNSTVTLVAATPSEQIVVVEWDFEVFAPNLTSNGYYPIILESSDAAVTIDAKQLVMDTAVGIALASFDGPHIKPVPLPVSTGVRLRSPGGSGNTAVYGCLKYILI